MADPKGNQEHLGIDANVLVACLDSAHPLHGRVGWLAKEAIAFNPTIVHEAYHTLVFKARRNPEEASRALLDACSDPLNQFVNQTVRTTRLGLELAVRHHLGGRDALVLADLLGARIREFFTLDGDLTALKRVRFGKAALVIKAA